MIARSYVFVKRFAKKIDLILKKVRSIPFVLNFSVRQHLASGFLCRIAAENGGFLRDYGRISDVFKHIKMRKKIKMLKN